MFEQQLGGVISAQAGLSGRLDAGETLRGTVEAGGSAGSMPYEIGPGLKVESGVLSVDTAGAVEAENDGGAVFRVTLPVCTEGEGPVQLSAASAPLNCWNTVENEFLSWE